MSDLRYGEFADHRSAVNVVYRDAPAGELRTAQAELESAAAKMLKDEIDEDLQGAEISLEGAAGIIASFSLSE